MDETLKQLIAGPDGKPTREIDLSNLANGTVTVYTPDGPTPYTLKTLSELYGAGTGLDTLDPKDETFMPLMLRIEEDIATTYEKRPSLTDADVILALKPLTMDPEAPTQSDLVREQVEVGLRMVLSINDYSRQDVKMALKKILKSVERHNRIDGQRGYLTFIADFFGRR